MDLSPSAYVDTFARDNLPPVDQWPELTATLPELRYPQKVNCAVELLDHTVERLGRQRRCLVGTGGSWTYGEVQDEVDRVARVLVEDFGVVPGNRVLLRGPNSPYLVVCWLAILKAGGVVVTVLPALRSGELATVAELARVSHAVCDARFVEDLNAAEVEGLRTVTYGGAAGDLETRSAAKETGFPAVETAADDVSLIAFTSGTTGRPKGCMHFHRDVLAIADTFSRHVLRPGPDDVFAGSPPLAFTFGLGALVVFPMRVGAASVLLEKATGDALLGAIREHRVSVLFTAPTAYRGLLGALDHADISSLRRCVSAGEHLDPDTWRAWHRATGIGLIDGIGATEMLHIFISAADEYVRPGATGVPVPGFTASIVDVTGAAVPDGEPGLLAVRGPVGCRYLADERQRDYVRNGWNLTGDTYVRDGDGYFWFRSRADDLIVSAGYNIAAAEVEEAVLHWPGVAETAVVGVPDPVRGQAVKAFVVLDDTVPVTGETEAELQEFVRSRIAPYKAPRVVEFIAALPRTPTGKVQRFKLRDQG
ncbi:AMP-binding protein [Allosaccharopolyspora coralli]|uniref:AMP-binding protein n=1 Tax=Allosaccharopolyspora coralli TaxID=2665642 RepID=A0A5Q3QGZ1_9PSEU|nr:AMP-binding protein [Allosaccharopolyspora coralli]QGK70087.1 AMP-binding protein [Allosaccharopolyspora coralli]